MKRATLFLLILSTIFYFLSCSKDESGTLPSVFTVDEIDVTETTAQINGLIISNDDLKIKDMGVCWDLEPDPTTSNSKITIVPSINSGDTLEFHAIITGLITKTTYYFRVYATNTVGTAYSECSMLCTCK
jgi:hypothetical protein